MKNKGLIVLFVSYLFGLIISETISRTGVVVAGLKTLNFIQLLQVSYLGSFNFYLFGMAPLIRKNFLM